MMKEKALALLRELAREAELIKLAAQQADESLTEAQGEKEVQENFKHFEESFMALRKELTQVDFCDDIYELLFCGLQEEKK